MFGGTDDSAQKAQKRANAGVKALIAKLAKEAKGEAKALFSGAQESQRLGFQGALDVSGAAIPQQLGTFQRGNVLAQEVITRGLPQFQKAILGQPVDFREFKSQTIPFSTDFIPKQLPQTRGIEQVLAPEEQQTTLTPEQIAALNIPGGF